MNALIEFFFPYRLRRLDYFLRMLATDAFLFFLYGNNWLLNPVFCGGLMFAVVLYQIFFIMCPRLRDVGMRWWMVFVGIIPIINFWISAILILRPSEYPSGASVANADAKSIVNPDSEATLSVVEPSRGN